MCDLLSWELFLLLTNSPNTNENKIKDLKAWIFFSAFCIVILLGLLLSIIKTKVFLSRHIFTSDTNWRWEKTQEEGGVKLCFQNFTFSRYKNCSQDQSLIEFRVLMQRIESKRAEKERTQAIIQVPSTNRK